VSRHDQLRGHFNTITMLAASDELAHGPTCRFLHRDALGLGSLAKSFLFTIGKS
jgi:hypothetical protein